MKPGGGAWTYRCFEEPSQTNENIATGILAFTFWWIFYGIFTEPEHLFGHEPYPDTDKYTDEELGIPPDDEE